MKKLFIALVCALFTVNVFADHGKGICMISGTNDYVQVTADAYADGTGSFTISNASVTKPVVTLYIEITAEFAIKYTDRTEWQERTIYSGDITETILPTTHVEKTFTFQGTGLGFRNVQVHVSNAICK